MLKYVLVTLAFLGVFLLEMPSLLQEKSKKNYIVFGALFTVGIIITLYKVIFVDVVTPVALIQMLVGKIFK